MTTRIGVSILVKALNEEDKIERCLASAVREAADVGGEVILVDSMSTDATVNLARRFPVRIVQPNSVADRGCGAATQLGYQFSQGEYLYLVDGDMELQAGFLALAIEHLEADPSLGGVGGLTIDTQLRTPADRRRAERYAAIRSPIAVSHLGGGGLYRRKAIDSVGYLANRWLKACEEAELGLRLRSKGWRLVRLPVPAVMHTGHNESGTRMLLRLWRSGRMKAHGLFLRYAFGRAWWWPSLRVAWMVLAAPTLYLLAFCIAVAMMWLGGNRFVESLAAATIVCWGIVLAVLYTKKRSLADSLFAVAAWHLYALASVPALFQTIADPAEPIPARELGLSGRESPETAAGFALVGGREAT